MFVLLCRLGRLFTTRMTNTFNGEGTSDAVDNNVANGKIKVELNAQRLVFHGRIQDLPLVMSAELKLEWLVLQKTPEAAVESLNHS